MDNLNFNTQETTYREESVMGTLMRNVYLWMTLALVITGLTALVVARSEAILSLLFANNWIWIGLIIAELLLVMSLSARLDRLTFSNATILFILYSAINGLTLAPIFLIYQLGSIETTFFITAGTFGAMAAIGSFTKKDLSGIGKFCLMALIGLIIAAVVNLFLHNTMLDLIVSAIGVLIFAALTAYDTQKIREMLGNAADVDDSSMKIALFGSLSLYLDFINLFLYLLRFFGRRD